MSTIADLLSGFRDYLDARDNEPLRRFIDNFAWTMKERSLEPRSLPVVDVLGHLDGAGAERDLLASLSARADTLQWGQTYGSGDFGEAFLERYGWVELFGTRGHFASDVMAGGFLLLGPQIHYPDHHHVAEEIYIPLTSGSLWSKDAGVFVERDAGEIIHHPSNIRHAMRTNDRPLVALYLWRGGPLAQKSIISGKDR